MGDKKGPPPKTIPGYMNFIIGGCSGMLATCVVQPADLVKTRMQLMGPAGKNMSSMSVAGDILKKEGPFGFYSGLSAALFRQATYTTGRLGVFNALTDYYKDLYGVPSFPIKICMGVIAGGLGAFVGTPAEVALIRMTADGRLPPDKRRNYKHIFNALGRITKEEGLTTLWRGAVATITRAMVVNAAQLGTYAQARESLLPVMGDGLHLHFSASMISGFVTTVASLPVDIVKTRVQNAAKGAGQVTVLMGVIKNEGILALWSGFIPTYAKIGPHTVITFIFLEQLNSLYLKMANLPARLRARNCSLCLDVLEANAQIRARHVLPYQASTSSSDCKNFSQRLSRSCLSLLSEVACRQPAARRDGPASPANTPARRRQFPTDQDFTKVWQQ